MSSQTLRQPTLLSSLWPATSHQALARNLLLAFVGTGLLTLSAKIQIPFYPVPLTMQTFMVLVLGMVFGSRLGAATVALYLFEGALGLPVFAGTPEKGLGLAYMMGSTGGYLLGFLIAAAVAGWLAERGWDRNPWLALAAMTIGTAIIFLPGLLWLGAIIGWEKPIFALGFYPFIYGSIFKIVLGALALRSAWVIFGKKTD